MFKDFEETKKGHLMFWRPKDTMKGKRHNFSCHKQKDKGYLVYLQGKLEEVGYGWGIFNLKYHKTAERTHFSDNQKARKVLALFLHVLTERQQLQFWTVSINKKGTVYVISFWEPQNKQ